MRTGGKHGRAAPCRGDVGLRPPNFVCPAIESYSRIYNYSADAGAGSNTITVISESPAWREGSPSGVGPFRIATSTDDVLANIGAGLDVIGSEGASFRLYYEGRFGDTVEQHAGGIKASLPF